MTLKRLAILLAILIFLAGVGIAWLWQYAYSPQGRARVIIGQLKGDTTSLRGWMLQHHLIRPGFPKPPSGASIQEAKRLEVSLLAPLSHAAEIIAASDEIAKIGPKAVPIAIQALQDEDFDVRVTAILACGKIRDPAAIQPLADCMKAEDRDSKRIREKRNQYPTPLIRGLMPNEFYTNQLCVDSLLEFGQEGYGPLMKAAQECDPFVKELLPMKLAAKWGVAAVPHLIELLDNPDADFRASAVFELEKFKDRRATDALVRHLSDSVVAIRWGAADALGEIGNPKAIPALLRVLNDSHEENKIRVSAAGALARMGWDEGLPCILAAIKSPDRMDRANAARALATNQIKGTLDPLLSMLGDREGYIRLVAVRAVGKLRDPSAIPALRKLLDDPERNVRQSADEALEKLGVKPSPASQRGNP